MEEWVAVGGMCWTEWRQDCGGNTSLSINVCVLVSSVSHFIHEDRRPDDMQTDILLLKRCSRSRACWTVGMKTNPPNPK